MSEPANASRVLIAGASGGIGQTLADHFLHKAHTDLVMTVSRQHIDSTSPSHRHLRTDLSSPHCVSQLIELFREHGRPDQVYHCAGILHDESHGPEKALSQLTADWLQHSLGVNVLAHVHLAQAIDEVMDRRSELRWLSLSALIGSIEDNRSGGWYSYRMTKAALNMFIKTLSIEWRRRYPNAIVAAVHPGTTDTPLSEPFQSGLKPDALYSAKLTAERMISVMNGLDNDDSGGYFHFDGTLLRW